MNRSSVQFLIAVAVTSAATCFALGCGNDPDKTDKGGEDAGTVDDGGGT